MRAYIPALILAWIMIASWVYADYRLGQYEDKVHELECRHVLFEDGSSLHKDAELTMACINR